jgi:L-ectoine synthase
VIVRSLEELIGTDRDVDWGHGRSRRFLLVKDGMGFTLTDTVVQAGSESILAYPSHLEACYCIEGEGEVEDARGNRYPIKPGTMYALDEHDEHRVRATTTMRLVCVFSPALSGVERAFDSLRGPAATRASR